MDIIIRRFEYGTNYTIGRLYVNGVYHCFTLEDRVREIENIPVEEWKVKDNTAIPKGHYEIEIKFSMHFGKEFPHLKDVTGFDDVLIHKGNTDKDTSGCILVGRDWAGSDFISNCIPAYDKLLSQIKTAIKNKEDVVVTIK
jgi:hypothetical protein